MIPQWNANDAIIMSFFFKIPDFLSGIMRFPSIKNRDTQNQRLRHHNLTEVLL